MIINSQEVAEGFHCGPGLENVVKHTKLTRPLVKRQNTSFYFPVNTLTNIIFLLINELLWQPLGSPTIAHIIAASVFLMLESTGAGKIRRLKYEHSNNDEPLGSTKCWELLDWL
jgi:hypothetical protein